MALSCPSALPGLSARAGRGVCAEGRSRAAARERQALTSCTKRAQPADAESLGREFFPLDKLPASMAGSTDMGNVSYRVPSIHPMLQSAPRGCNIHNAAFADHAVAPIGDEAAIDGAKALAMTAIDFLCDPDLRARSKANFEQSAQKSGGGSRND